MSDERQTDFKIGDDPRFVRNLDELNRRAHGGTRIIGGKKVRRGEFLDCVAVGPDTGWECTGTLIGPNVVLTAGHCAGLATRVFFGNDVDDTGTVTAVSRSVLHPDYGGAEHNDLMVLILRDRASVEPRRLASRAQIDAATDGRAVGFGNVDATGRYGYGVKRLVDLPIASADCRGAVGGRHDTEVYGCDGGLEIVAGRRELRRDTCKGDSGGPFYILDDGEWLLAGATSRATETASSVCGDGGIYVRVDHYREWIEGVIGFELP